MLRPKFLIAFIAAASLSACSNIPDKPVTEELTAKEVTAAVKSDSLFAKLYDIARFRSALMQSAEAARYKELSYKDALKYLHYIEDSAYWNKQKTEMTEEWNVRNKFYLGKTDSVINAYRKNISSTHISDYINIFPVSVTERRSYFLFSSKYRTMAFDFEISAPRENIKKLIFSYGFIDNIDKDNFNFAATEFYDGRISNEKQKYSGQKFAVYTYPLPDLKEFENELGLFILPQLLVFDNNDTINVRTDTIPVNILKCICINKAKYPAAYEKHRARAMQELFNEQANDKNKYVEDRIKDMKKEENELAYEFFQIESY